MLRSIRPVRPVDFSARFSESVSRSGPARGPPGPCTRMAPIPALVREYVYLSVRRLMRSWYFALVCQGAEHGDEMLSRDPARHTGAMSGRDVRRLPAPLRRTAGRADAAGGPRTLHDDSAIRAILPRFGDHHFPWRLSDVSRCYVVPSRYCLSVRWAALLITSPL